MRGFTLLEIMVSLLVSTIVVVAGHELFAGVGAVSDRLERAARAADRAANGSRVLMRLIGSMEPGSIASGSIEGSPAAVRFLSRWAPGGRRAAQVPVVISAEAPFLIAILDADTLLLSEDVERAVFEYLPENGSRQAWRPEWRSAVTAPAAIRVRVTRADGSADTSLYAVGPRG